MSYPIQHPLSAHKIQQAFPELVASIEGDEKKLFSSVASGVDASAADLALLYSDESLKGASGRPFGLLILSEKKRAQAADINAHAKIYTHQPDWLMAEILHTYVKPSPYRPRLTGHHASAVISETATIHPTAIIAPLAVIGEQVTIGPNAFIGSHSVIEERAEIGAHTTIHPHVYIGSQTKIGEACEIMPQAVVGKDGFGYAHNARGDHRRYPHIGRAVLGNRVHIGAGSTVDRGTFGDTFIDDGVIIDNLCHIAHNCKIGKNTVIAAMFVVAGSTEIGSNCVFGGRVSVTGHIKVTDGVQIAAVSSITKDHLMPGQFGGYPLQPVKDFLRSRASLPHLPEMRKQLALLMKNVFPDNSEKGL